MAGSDHVAALRTFFGQFDRHEFDAVKQHFTDGFVLHMAGAPQPMTAEEFVGFGTMFYAAIPDLTHTIDAVVVDGDVVAIRLTVAGTHRNELLGVPGSGCLVSVSSYDFFRFQGDKIAEQWVVFDTMGLMQQIGALPVPGAA